MHAYKYIQPYGHAHIQAGIHTSGTHRCTHIPAYMRTYAHTCMHIHIHMHIHILAHAHTDTNTQTYMYTYRHACILTYRHIYIHTYTYACIQTYIHT